MSTTTPNLAEWLRKQLDDQLVTQFRLELIVPGGSFTEGGEVIQTWEREQVENVDAWLVEAEHIVGILKEDLPTRRHRLIWIAADVTGTPRGQLFKAISGTNKEAPKTGDAAAANAMHALARTMQDVLAMSNAQLTSATAVIKAQAENVASQTQLIIELRNQMALAQQRREPGEADRLIGEVLKEVPEFLRDWAKGEFGGN